MLKITFLFELLNLNLKSRIRKSETFFFFFFLAVWPLKSCALKDEAPFHFSLICVPRLLPFGFLPFFLSFGIFWAPKWRPKQLTKEEEEKERTKDRKKASLLILVLLFLGASFHFWFAPILNCSTIWQAHNLHEQQTFRVLFLLLFFYKKICLLRTWNLQLKVRNFKFQAPQSLRLQKFEVRSAKQLRGKKRRKEKKKEIFSRFFSILLLPPLLLQRPTKEELYKLKLTTSQFQTFICHFQSPHKHFTNDTHKQKQQIANRQKPQQHPAAS